MDSWTWAIAAVLVIGGVLAFIGVMRSPRDSSARTSGMGFANQPAPPAPEAAPAAPQYNPDKIGNDASARPWERASMAFDSAKYAGVTGAKAAGAPAASQGSGMPAGFDRETFVEAAKRDFLALQAAWDRSDTATLRSMMTAGMAAQIGRQLAARAAEGGTASRTDVEMLGVQLLAIEDRGSDYLASIEFSGMVREDPQAGPTPFREVWNMTRPKGDTGHWLVAGVQALQ